MTVLFADIVGSTAAVAEHDPEVVRESLAGVFERLREILVAHGGTVEKFIGDAVMAVFGVPAAHDDDAQRAVRAAFAMRDAIAGTGEPAELPLDLRIGVNTGEAVAGSGEGAQLLVTGEPVNRAARLQQFAAPGEIVVGDLTRTLTSAVVRYDPSRSIEAKGLGPIDASVARALLSDLPEQDRGLPGRRAVLIGRDQEMGLLRGAYQRVPGDRRPYLVTLYGPAGAGKSRLAKEFADAIAPAAVWRGRCLPYGQGITYWPISEMLRADAGIDAADSAEDFVTKIRTAVLRTFGENGDADAVAKRLAVLAGASRADEMLASVPLEDIAQELRWSMRRYVERRAAKAPLTLVFEDIHWAEPGLLDLIEHLAEWSRAPLFLLCLARPDLLDARPGWGGGRTNAAAIPLGPLTGDESRRLIGELLAVDALPDSLRDMVIARADGNPLYVEEFLRMLIESGDVEEREGRWVAVSRVEDLLVPPTLQALIGARIDRVPSGVKEVLQRASVIGQVFWTAALAGIGADPAALEDTLTSASRRDLVLELDEGGPGGGEGYRFKHVLIRDVVYAAITKAERQRLHDSFGRWLEKATIEQAERFADIVTYHAEQAYLFAHEVRASGARALGERAFGMLLATAGAAYARADYHAATVLFERALAIGERIGAGAGEMLDARGYAALCRDALEGTRATTTAIDEVLRIAEGVPARPVTADLLVSRASLMLTESAKRAEQLMDAGIGAARAVGDPQTVARAMMESYGPPWVVGDVAEARRRLQEARAFMVAHGTHRERALCLGYIEMTHRVAGEFTQAAEYGELAEAAVAATGSQLGRLQRLYGRAESTLLVGDLAGALPLAEQNLLASRELGVRTWVGWADLLLGEVHYAMGDFARSRTYLEEGLVALDPVTMRGIVPEMALRLSRTCLAVGDHTAARENAELARQLLSPEDITAVAGARAALAAVHGAEGDRAVAERLYREAVEIAAGSGFRDLLARLREQLAGFLIAAGRSAEARSLLEEIRDFYRDPLAVRVRARVDALLRRCDEVASP